MPGARIFSPMDEPHSADELTNIRKFLERLELGYMTVRKDGVDITKREIGVLKAGNCRSRRCPGTPKG